MEIDLWEGLKIISMSLHPIMAKGLHPMNRKNTETHKFCPKCKRFLTRDNFAYHKSRHDNCSPYCTECTKKINRERYQLKRIKVENGYKKCSDCKKILLISKFNKNKSNKDGLQKICRSCQYIREKEYRKTENGKKRDKKYIESEKGKETRKNAIKRYKETEKYKKNSLYRNISNGIRYSLKEGKKDSSWINLVDFTLDELREHIESQFKEGMTWKNYGSGWHIDHIRPISSFNITNCLSKDFKECWSLENLQPLWAKENQSKGSKWQGKDWRYND